MIAVINQQSTIKNQFTQASLHCDKSISEIINRRNSWSTKQAWWSSVSMKYVTDPLLSPSSKCTVKYLASLLSTNNET